jgi:hypothetical protein
MEKADKLHASSSSAHSISEGVDAAEEPATNHAEGIVPITREQLTQDASEILEILEPVHRTIVLYLWLSYRLPLIFKDQDDAFLIKEKVESAIERTLNSIQSPSARFLADAKLLETESVSKPFCWEYETIENAMKPAKRGPRLAEVHLPY